ncbi:hypothetical protein ACVWXO_007583 [Bradyrhizobium sp. LM2.7]
MTNNYERTTSQSHEDTLEDSQLSTVPARTRSAISGVTEATLALQLSF